MIIFILCCIIQRLFRGVAQFGSALGSGPRGRGFKSRHLDQKERRILRRSFFVFNQCDKQCASRLHIRADPAKSKSTPKPVCFYFWQGRRDSNTQPTVLETATLPLSHSPKHTYSTLIYRLSQEKVCLFSKFIYRFLSLKNFIFSHSPLRNRFTSFQSGMYLESIDLNPAP